MTKEVGSEGSRGGHGGFIGGGDGNFDQWRLDHHQFMHNWDEVICIHWASTQWWQASLKWIYQPVACQGRVEVHALCHSWRNLSNRCVWVSWVFGYRETHHKSDLHTPFISLYIWQKLFFFSFIFKLSAILSLSPFLDKLQNFLSSSENLFKTFQTFSQIVFLYKWPVRKLLESTATRRKFPSMKVTN